ncbi:hypothetical protein SLE2022_054930 [Rubroshorea leprosula]
MVMQSVIEFLENFLEIISRKEPQSHRPTPPFEKPKNPGSALLCSFRLLLLLVGANFSDFWISRILPALPAGLPQFAASVCLLKIPGSCSLGHFSTWIESSVLCDLRKRSQGRGKTRGVTS